MKGGKNKSTPSTRSRASRSAAGSGRNAASKQPQEQQQESPRQPSTRSSGRLSANNSASKASVTKQTRNSNSAVSPPKRPSQNGKANSSPSPANGSRITKVNGNGSKDSIPTRSSRISNSSPGPTTTTTPPPPNESKTTTPIATSTTRSTRHKRKASGDPTPPTPPKESTPLPVAQSNLFMASSDTGKPVRVTIRIDNRIYSPIDTDGNRYSCTVCSDFGSVVCCDGCPRVFHHQCVPAESESRQSLEADADPWYCPICQCTSCKDASCAACTGLLQQKTQVSPTAETAAVTTESAAKRPADAAPIKSSEKKRRKKTNPKPKRRASTDLAASIIATDSVPDTPLEQRRPEPPRPPSAVVEAQPAFLFYLNENRWKIEKSLLRGHRTFNRLPKGNERNSLIAQEALQWWTKLGDSDKKPYIDMAIQEYQERVLQWKEEKNAREFYRGEGSEDIERVLESEKLRSAAERHDRLYQQASVGSKPFKPEADQSYNRVLLDLLHDTRFHPLPLFTTNRSDTSMPSTADEQFNVKVTIPFFEVHGPISTSLGDECTGCSRGWNHFCPVMQRRIPAIENRAKLQPPMSSLMATRVGLGLRPRNGATISSEQKPALFQWEESSEAREIRNLKVVPSSTAFNPSQRVDEIVHFIEETAAMKIPEPPRPNSMTDDVNEKSNAADAAAYQKCGRCRTIVLGDTGCVQCRRAQLVINKSKKPPPGSNSLKVKTAMLGRLQTKEWPEEFGIGSDRHLSESLLKLRWCPSAILPPRLVQAPEHMEEEDSVEEDYATSSDEKSGGESSNMAPFTDDVEEKSDTSSTTKHTIEEKQSALPTSGKPDGLSSTVGPEEGVTEEQTHQTASDATNGDDKPTSNEVSSIPKTNGDDTVATEQATGEEESTMRRRTRPSRTATLNRLQSQTPVQRNDELKRHQKEASDVQKRALQVACYCMFLALIRRDPLHLFASPAQAEGYSEMIKNPIDFGMIREDVLAGKYSSLNSFCSDVKLLCENSLAFNAPNSVYYKTAEDMHGLVTAMQKRAINWIGAIKDAYAGSFLRREAKKRQSGSEGDYQTDAFEELRGKWPEALQILENEDHFRSLVEADFSRTEENELAFYGSIAVCRAATAAESSLAPYPTSGGYHSVVVQRKHYEDEDLRTMVDERVSQVEYPQLKSVSTWREESVVRLAKKVQKSRLEKLTISEHGCSRCDPLEKSSVKPVSERPLRPRKKEGDCSRVAPSRIAQATGLGSEKTRLQVESRSNQSHEDQIESLDHSCVSIRGSKVHGMGLFADQTFKQGEVVAEYRGEYITNAIADIREKHYRDQRIQDYQFRSNDMIVDATMKGGAARYINHNCSPNCIAKIIPNKNNPQLKRLIIIAQRDIELNEEISYDYQFPLELDLRARVPCNCGSDQCRGFMNWDLPEKGSNNRALLVQKRGANIRDRIRRFARPLKRDEA